MSTRVTVEGLDSGHRRGSRQGHRRGSRQGHRRKPAT